MPEQRLKAVMGVARGILLLLLAGLLIARREFAHLNLGELFSAAHFTPPQFLSYAFVTETTLLALFPLALLRARERYEQATSDTRRERFVRAFGWASCAVLGLMVWGAGHAIVALLSGGDLYLILRQSAFSLIYPIAFLYALLFFGDSEEHTRLAVWSAVAIALVCATGDALHVLDPPPLPPGSPPIEWTPIYGQETLPIAILGLSYALVAARSWLSRGAALLGLLFTAWRQAARPMQSVVPIGMAVAIACFFLGSLLLAWRGQRATLKRTAWLFALIVAAGLSYSAAKFIAARFSSPEPSNTEFQAWRPSRYLELMKLFDSTQMPADPAARMIAKRPIPGTQTYLPVDDPEVYKLQAVFDAEHLRVSVRNNIWRVLVWRRMLADLHEGGAMHALAGAGVGKPWFYRALYQSSFHYGDDREGLDPHNSYLNMLYRYGIVGFALLLAAIGGTLHSAYRALRMAGGDRLLEALLLYFGYTLFFAFFTVSLEGPAYSMPFWMTLGLIYARAMQLRKDERSPRADNS